MNEEWREIAEFPKYRISDQGRIESLKSRRILVPSTNQQGQLKVNLLRDGETYTRSVNQLVGKTFMEPPKRNDFISLIHRDGNRWNCSVENMLWRPRYFAIKYHLQFDTQAFKTSHIPVREVKTRQEFSRIQEASMLYGLLFSEILAASHARTYVWPTYQFFEVIEN